MQRNPKQSESGKVVNMSLFTIGCTVRSYLKVCLKIVRRAILQIRFQTLQTTNTTPMGPWTKSDGGRSRSSQSSGLSGLKPS